MSPLGEAFRKAMANQPKVPAGKPQPRPRPVPQFDLNATPSATPATGTPAPEMPMQHPGAAPPAFDPLAGATAVGTGATTAPAAVGPPGFEPPPIPSGPNVLDRASRVATFAEGPLAPGCDELAGLRAALMACGLEGMSATVMIVGTAQPRAVTALSVGLAGELGRDLVHNVLLIDADVKDPGVGGILQVDPEFDFADVLDGRADAGEAILHSEVDNLSALPLRADPFLGTARVSAETLAGPLARDILTRLHEAFDYIVIDAGIVDATAVPRVLASQCTGVVMVLQAGTTRDRARACRSMLESAGGRLLGVVLAGGDAKR